MHPNLLKSSQGETQAFGIMSFIQETGILSSLLNALYNFGCKDCHYPLVTLLSKVVLNLLGRPLFLRLQKGGVGRVIEEAQ